MNKPFFSIIVPTFNRADLISACIKSVVDQQFTDWELIVVDDGSTDNTSEVVTSFQDERIRYQFKNHGERSGARNYGIDLAKGKFICFLDDDDYYRNNFLETFYDQFLKEGKQEMIFFCDQFEESLGGEIRYPQKKTRFLDNAVLFYIHYENNLQTYCFPATLVNEIRFEERFVMGEDFHFILRHLLYSQAKYIPVASCVYRAHRASSSVMEFDDFGTFLDLKYNKIDTFEDLYGKEKVKMKELGVLKDFLRYFNKIKYFYASASMKNQRLKTALSITRSIKGINTQTIYYRLSIFFRISIYFFKSKFLKN